MKFSIPSLRIATFTLTLVVLATLTSCSTPGDSEALEPGLNVVEREDVHAVHSERLRDVMGELFVLSIDSAPSGVAAAAVDPADVKLVQVAARDIARAAGGIPDILLDVKLPVEQKMAFLDAVETLRGESMRLEQGAPTMTRLQMREQLKRIDGACTACHGTFRFLPALDDELFFR